MSLPCEVTLDVRVYSCLRDTSGAEAHGKMTPFSDAGLVPDEYQPYLSYMLVFEYYRRSTAARE